MRSLQIGKSNGNAEILEDEPAYMRMSLRVYVFGEVMCILVWCRSRSKMANNHWSWECFVQINWQQLHQIAMLFRYFVSCESIQWSVCSSNASLFLLSLCQDMFTQLNSIKRIVLFMFYSWAFPALQFQNALFRRKSCVSGVFFSFQPPPPATRSIHQNAAHLAHSTRSPSSHWTIRWKISSDVSYQNWINIYLRQFFFRRSFWNRFAVLYIWDKVVVDDRRYKTSSPVCISSNSIRMRVHEHHAQKWLNACVTTDFCALHWHVSYCQRRKQNKCERERERERQSEREREEKNVCARFHGLWQKFTQSTVCD